MTKKQDDKKHFYHPLPTGSCGIGLIADLSCNPSHQIIADASELLINLSHRGAVGADQLLGDGAGFTFAIPDELLRVNVPIFPILVTMLLVCFL